MKITKNKLRQIIKEEQEETIRLDEVGGTASIAASIVGTLKTFKSPKARMEFIGAAIKTLAITVEQLKERIEKLEQEGSDS